MKLKIFILLGLALSAIAAPLSWQNLHFKDEAEGRQIQALRDALPALTESYTHHPFQVAGNFMGEGWTKGQTEVVNEYFMESPGSAWYQLRSLNTKLPEAFGCLLSAGRNPAENGIGIKFWYCSGGKTIIEDGADLTCTVWDQGRPKSSLSILHPILDIPSQYEVEGSKVARDWRADLKALSSAKSFKQTTKDRLEGARKRFYKSLESEKVWRLKYRQYLNEGVKPEGNRIHLSEEEASELKRYIDRQVEDRLAILEEYGDDMFQAFSEVVPLALLIDSDPEPTEPQKNPSL